VSTVPLLGSPQELSAFSDLQARLPAIYRDVFADPNAPRTVVVVPSMSLDAGELGKIPGVIHYEERMLCLLMLLRMPRTELVYLTSTSIDPAIIDYYLHLLPGVPRRHALRRLRFISMGNPSLEPLSKKLLSSRSTLEEVKRSISHPASAHMTTFNTTAYERSLAVELGLPLYGCDPALTHLGNKSMGRALLRSVGLDVPYGFEGLHDSRDLSGALVAISRHDPDLSRAVIKLNDGFSGEGNAVVDVRGLSESPEPYREAMRRVTGGTSFAGAGETWPAYEAKLAAMGGIVEVFIDEPQRRSPSVQMRITPDSELQLISTHDQLLSGPNGQIFEGCTFPADPTYRSFLHEAGRRIGQLLRERGVLGRFGVDFISVPTGVGWRHHAIEINLRKGGTTLPYLMLEFLTDGRYDPVSGDFHTPTGNSRCYYATDNLVRPEYRGLTPQQLIDRAVDVGLHYHTTTQQGVVFHLLGAVTEFGKIGMVSIAPTPTAAREQYERAVASLEMKTP
jgi:hypothetical protein